MPDYSQLAEEWDRFAPIRERQISSGIDLSYHYVNLPTVKDLSRRYDMESVVDAGCGIGHLTAIIGPECQNIRGIDVSEGSIKIAERLHAAPNISYVNSTLEDYAADPASLGTASLVIANMVLMDVPDLFGFLAAVTRLLRPGGGFVATLVHPWFWPRYWGYEGKSWFDYSREQAIRAPLKISLDTELNGETTHVHRPLEMYISEVLAHGFDIDALREPRPDPAKEEKFPKPWDTPRYLALGCHLRDE